MPLRAGPGSYPAFISSLSPLRLCPSLSHLERQQISYIVAHMRLSVRLSAFALVSVLSFPATHLSAQAIILPKSITFTGAPAYTQAELLSFSALTPGATSTSKAVQDAAQRLSDTGLFSDIRFQSNSSGLIFTLKQMPLENLLPVRFANFVWWNPADLDTLLRTRVPLYHGNVPLAGNLQDAILAVLKTLVVQKGVANPTIVPIASAPQPGATPTTIAFAIETPQVLVHSLTLAQSSPALQTKLEKVIKTQTGQPFEQDLTRTAITSQLSDIYRNEGYLDITVLDLTHPAPTLTANSIDLDLTATLREGEPYRLSALTWPGSDVISTADFEKSVKLHPEDVASQQALRQSLSPIAAAYYRKGYQDARVQAPATMVAATHHVAYTVRVIPGPQYRLKSVKAIGLNEQQQKDFAAAWRMAPNDFYDLNYVNGFLKSNSSITSLRGYSAAWKASADPETHLVDLILTFTKGGNLATP